MIEKSVLENILSEALTDTDYQLITCDIRPGDEILIEVDRMAGVDVDFCSQLNHRITEALDAHYGVDADYSLEVGSVSLTDPFKTRMQYEKNLGHDVEVLAADGRKYRGQLVSVDDDTFSVDVEVKVKKEGAKRPVTEVQTLTWPYTEVKYCRYDLKF